MNQQCVISTPLTKIEKIFNKASTMFPESKKILQAAKEVQSHIRIPHHHSLLKVITTKSNCLIIQPFVGRRSDVVKVGSHKLQQIYEDQVKMMKLADLMILIRFILHGHSCLTFDTRALGRIFGIHEKNNGLKSCKAGLLKSLLVKLKELSISGGPPMAPGGGNATIFEEDGSGNGSGEVEVEEFRFEDI
ncbi:hypothetical protein RIR_jg17833.t1 [Rhizophagus irregularis DAOM 181602=DAOM 197198]|nr:hypothetical protein RIR_jg17833.t1 [Rhizophagus irregularis DAOM 181602=DAOM 197198]